MAKQKGEIFIENIILSKTEEEIIESILIHSIESHNNSKLANKHFHKYTKLMCEILENDNNILYRFIKHKEPAMVLSRTFRKFFFAAI